MKEDLVTVAVYTYSHEAYLHKSVLEGDGIAVYLFDDLAVRTNPFSSFALGGIKLKVSAKDKERALEILNSGEIGEKED